MLWLYVLIGWLIVWCLRPVDTGLALLTLAIGLPLGLVADCVVCLVTWYEYGYRDDGGRLIWLGWRDFLSYWKRPHRERTLR